tara:strand:+ start:6842 stop:7597 length:756 start_codon:yes stop_codon:yes gene_type:complete
MIIEALQHFLTPAPKYVKDMGYVREAIAIEARYKRCAGDWQPHLEKCKSLILAGVGRLPAGSTVMILGSGGLHDVPVEVLLDRGLHVTCVDIVHLPKVENSYPGITFVTRDITGMIEPLFNAVKKGTRVQADPEWEFLRAPDLIISLNLLSQLAMKLVDYAQTYGDDLGVNFSDNILKAHVDWLRNQQTNTLLISDISRDYYQGQRLVETIPSLPKLALSEPDETWVWDIAPEGEADREISIKHNVGAWTL